MVLRSSDRISRVPPYLIRPIVLHIRDYHPLWLRFPTHSIHTHGSAGPRSLAATRGVSIDFLSSGYLDVSVPRVCFYKPMYSVYKYLFQNTINYRSNYNELSGGFPHSEIFGYNGYSHLPEAYRRVSRPSSPLTAKAFTKRPSRA